MMAINSYKQNYNNLPFVNKIKMLYIRKYPIVYWSLCYRLLYKSLKPSIKK